MGPNPYWAMFLNRVRHLGELSLQLWLGRTSCAVCLGIYVQKLASGVFESHALSSASRPCPGIGKSALLAENA
jgi:hypothetical protein